MQWNASIKALPLTPSNFLVAAIYDSSAPSVLIQSIALPKPYTGAAIQVTFLSVNPIVYNFILWESPTTAPSGIVLNTFSFQPTSSTTLIRADLHIQADTFGGPTSGQPAYVDTSLAGWTYEVERIGQGTMTPGVDYAVDLTGGWHLIKSGDVIGASEKFDMRFTPQVQTNSITAVANTFVTAAEVITASTALSAADIGKAILIKGAASFLTLTLPPLSTVQDLKLLTLYSRGGSHTNANIVCAGTDTIDWPTTTVITLAQCEKLSIYKYNGVWNVEFASPGVLNVGQVILDYLLTKLNTVNSAGQLLSRTQYSRLWAYVQTLDASSFISEASWTNTSVINGITYSVNKGKYTNGDGSTTFRVPLLYNYGTLKFIDGATRKAGSLQAGQVGAFSSGVTIPGPNTSKNAGGGPLVATGSGPNDADRTQADPWSFNAGLENYATNVGLYGLIRI